MFHGTPPGAGRARMRQSVLDADIRRAVRDRRPGAELALLGIFFALLPPLGGDGSGSLEVFPSGKISSCIHRTLTLVIRSRAVEVMLHVVFASPDYHDRFACGFRHLRG